MRSQVRFFLEADDERAFIQEIMAELNTLLIDGQTWNTPKPPLLDPANLHADTYCVAIWNQADVPKLKAKKTGDSWEMQNEENLTIQYLRSQFWNETILCEGRISVATTRSGAKIEKRYRKLRKFIQSFCQNEVVCWWYPPGPRTEKNPSKPDQSTWVGPGALQWLRSRRGRTFKQDAFSCTEGILCAAK